MAMFPIGAGMCAAIGRAHTCPNGEHSLPDVISELVFSNEVIAKLFFQLPTHTGNRAII